MRIGAGTTAAAIITAVIIVIDRTGGELAAQIIAQQRLQWRHFDQRWQR